MNEDTGAAEGPDREEVRTMSTPELRELLATTSAPTVAAWAIRELPVVPTDSSVDTTVPAVAEAVRRFEDEPYYAVAAYLRRVDAPEALTEHPDLVQAALRDGPIHDDNFVHDVTCPIDLLGRRGHPAADTFVEPLVAALDREPNGHEGATSLLETLRRIQFAEADFEPGASWSPGESGSGQTVSLSEHAERVAEHATAVADVLARQHAPGVAHTSRTATTALVVLRGIAATDPDAVADPHVLQQVVRALRQFSPSGRAFHEARGVLKRVAASRPEQVTRHVDPVVASVAAALRAADPDPDPDARRDPRKTATKRLALVVDLLETHPAATVEAAGWANLESAFADAGAATRDAGGALLDAATAVEDPLGRALLLRLVGIAARESPDAFADELGRVDTVVETATHAEGQDSRRSPRSVLEAAADTVHWAVEGSD